MAELVTAQPMNLPVGPTEESGVGWNGLLTLIATEAALFGFLLFSYFYIGASAPLPWVAEARPDLTDLAVDAQAVELTRGRTDDTRQIRPGRHQRRRRCESRDRVLKRQARSEALRKALLRGDVGI